PRCGHAVAAVVGLRADVPEALRAQARGHVSEVVEAQIGGRASEGQGLAAEVGVPVERDPAAAAGALAEQTATVIADRARTQAGRETGVVLARAARPRWPRGKQGAGAPPPVRPAQPHAPAGGPPAVGAALAGEPAIVVAHRALRTGSQIERCVPPCPDDGPAL